ncbi:MAG: RnfH family protein [Rhodoferax sp.]|nr:RnfH family protein [Rhodoferax sp.]
MASERRIRVTVAWSPRPAEVVEIPLEVPPGTTVQQALGSGDLARQDFGDDTTGGVGVWGRRVPPDQVLCEGDRIEVYRGLRVDPRVARRERFQRQGSRSAGLFASRRPDAKPGY